MSLFDKAYSVFTPAEGVGKVYIKVLNAGDHFSPWKMATTEQSWRTGHPLLNWYNRFNQLQSESFITQSPIKWLVAAIIITSLAIVKTRHIVLSSGDKCFYIPAARSQHNTCWLLPQRCWLMAIPLLPLLIRERDTPPTKDLLK